MDIRVDCGRLNFPHARSLDGFLRSLRRLHHDLGEEYRLLVEEGFEREQDPEGRPWQALAPSTVRARKGQAHPILRRSGHLSRTHLRATEQEAVVGSNLPYAAIHQYGGEVRREARRATLHFRTYRRGRHRGRTLFARARRATSSREVQMGPVTVRIPARPWLHGRDGSVPRAWLQRLAAVAARQMEAALA